MLRSARAVRSNVLRGALECRRLTGTQVQQPRKEGDISSVFKSFSGSGNAEQLPLHFANVKRELLKDRDALKASWERLLKRLRDETEEIKVLGSESIPQINYSDIENAPASFKKALRKTGVALVREVVPEKEAREYKTQAEEYIAANPSTRAFPQHDPQVYELYWSKPQLAARSHPNMLKAQAFLMSYWHSRNPYALCSTNQPLTYVDRLRIRRPGDTSFALGPHVDGGSVERWEKNGYGAGKVYDDVFDGRWEDFDPWELSTRLDAKQDLHEGVGACTMFRMFQGWLSMSHTGPGEGTLLVNPMLSLSIAYLLLRPFFTPKTVPALPVVGTYAQEYLDPKNWILEDKPVTSALQGAWPGHGQELSHVWHPHLDLPHTMVHIPQVRPGDYIAWHCDTIHAVDKVHAGKGDSSVLYIPTAPTTKANIECARRQHEAFIKGIPPADFPGGIGESEHVGRPGIGELEKIASKEGLRAAGLYPFDVSLAKSEGEAEILQYANSVFGHQ